MFIIFAEKYPTFSLLNCRQINLKIGDELNILLKQQNYLEKRRQTSKTKSDLFMYIFKKLTSCNCRKSKLMNYPHLFSNIQFLQASLSVPEKLISVTKAYLYVRSFSL